MVAVHAVGGVYFGHVMLLAGVNPEVVRFLDHIRLDHEVG